MSFPWNIPLNLIDMLVSLTLTVSGFLIGTASFVLGLYLSQFEKMASEVKLKPYFYLIISLVIPPLIIIVMTDMIIICSCEQLWLKTYLSAIMLTPVIPGIVILLILKKNKPGNWRI